MFEPIDADPAAGQVRQITFVPFLADGRCVLIEERDGPALATGEVRDGEDYVLDTVLRVPLETVQERIGHALTGSFPLDVSSGSAPKGRGCSREVRRRDSQGCR